MPTPARHMVLNLFLTPYGYHSGGWRMPGSRSDELATFKVAVDMVKQAERAKLDAIFLSDALALGEDDGKRPNVHKLEPLTSLAALSSVTKSIGLIATASTTFTEPYNLARNFATLDHLSGGRAGWNIVTSFRGSENFGAEMIEHDERYLRALEYMEVVIALWNSWQDDAIVNDKEGGYWARPERIHPINFEGTHYRVKGPLNIARSPQGWPVLMQAGSSDSGMDFASKYAEVVFTVQSNLESAQSFYSETKKRVANVGRNPAKMKVLPGMMAIIGDTEVHAQQLADELADNVDQEVGKAALSWQLNNVDLEGLKLDQTIPIERLLRPEEVQGSRARYELYYKLATEDGYTLQQLMRIGSGAAGHPVVVGTVEQVADVMQEWFTQDGCDGFNLEAPYVMAGLDSITDQLIPELQQRGLFRMEYEGTTLRDHLGLNRPGERRVTPE